MSHATHNARRDKVTDRTRRINALETVVNPTDWQARVEEMMAQLATHPELDLDLPPIGPFPGGNHGEIPRGPWDGIPVVVHNPGSDPLPNWPVFPNLPNFPNFPNHPGTDPLPNLPGGGNTTSHGLPGNDTLAGTDANDSFFGGRGDDVLNGNAGNDRLRGGRDNDTINGGIGNDMLNGGRGDDALVGGAGNDVLRGGKGNDTLTGGDGSDTYWFGRGGGQDVINNTDAAADSNDVLRLGPAVTLDQLTFEHVGDAMKISIAGTDDTITVTGWYASPNNRLDGIQLASGDVITATQIENLVASMAAFAPIEISGVPSTELGSNMMPIAVGIGSGDLR